MSIMIQREELQALFNTYGTYKEIIEILGMDSNAGGGYRTIKTYINKYAIDLTEFEKLKVISTKQKHAELSKHIRKHTTENVFRVHTIKVSRETLKKFMLDSGVFRYECSECNIPDAYNGKPITLQIDHKDGNCLNNVMSNLRFLCPNCHSQTHNYGSKNRTNKKMRGLTRAEFWEKRNGELVEVNREKIEQILASDIDFTRFGWTSKAAVILGKPPQKVAKWMRKYMIEFYETRCYKRKTPA